MDASCDRLNESMERAMWRRRWKCDVSLEAHCSQILRNDVAATTASFVLLRLFSRNCRRGCESARKTQEMLSQYVRLATYNAHNLI